MFAKYAITIVSLLIIAQPASAGDHACQQAYSSSVSQCAQELDALTPKLRPGAQKACVQEAKVAKDACLAGPNLCLNACQATYDSNVNSCQLTYNPAVCGGSPTCESFYQQLRADCISASVEILNTCSAGCQ